MRYFRYYTIMFLILLSFITTDKTSLAKVIEADDETHDNTSLKDPMTPSVGVSTPVTIGQNQNYSLFGIPDLVKAGGSTVSATGNDFGKATSDNTYSFTSSGIITNKKGIVIPWTLVLAEKETEVSNEIVKSSKDNFKVNSVSGDLDLSNGDTLWGEVQVRPLLEERGNTVLIRITVHGDDAYLLIDNHSGTNVEWTLAGIDKYKDAVKQGIFTGGMSAGFNLYSVYSQYNVLLSEVLTNTDGTGELKSNANLKYSSEIFFHPIVGKLKTSLGKNKVLNYKDVEDKANAIQVTHSSKDKVTYEVNADYRIFNDKTTQERGFFTKIQNTNSSINQGLTHYTSKYNNKVKKVLGGLADTSMYLTIPHKYELETVTKVYKLKDNGYKIIKDLRLVAHKNEVYEVENGELVLKGKFSDYGLDPKEMMVYKTVADGETVGAIIPLRYKEVIHNTQDGKTHYTGRYVILNGDFKKKLTLDKPNKDILSVVGEMADGEPLRSFAFPENSSYKKLEAHADLGNEAGVITLQADYIKPSGGKALFGTIMVRNNTYAKDTKLLEWLDTPKAQSMEGVDAQLLKKLILGDMKVEDEGLSYEEWLRLQEIKQEMAGTWETKLKSTLYSILMLGGFLLIVYSVLFSLFYFVDTMTFFTDVSIMHIMTFGRCYPVEDLEHAGEYGVGGETRYITMKIALLTTFFGCFVGAMFMCVEPVLNFITWFYLHILDITEKLG